jgi:hypothetical protein
VRPGSLTKVWTTKQHRQNTTDGNDPKGNLPLGHYFKAFPLGSFPSVVFSSSRFLKIASSSAIDIALLERRAVAEGFQDQGV